MKLPIQHEGSLACLAPKKPNNTTLNPNMHRYVLVIQVLVYWSLALKGAIVRVDPFQSFPTWVSYAMMTHYWLRNDHCAQYGSSLSQNTKLNDFKMSHDHNK
jgi:hypothetical protein